MGGQGPGREPAEVREGLAEKVTLQHGPALEEVRERAESTPRGRPSQAEPRGVLVPVVQGPRLCRVTRLIRSDRKLLFFLPKGKCS